MGEDVANFIRGRWKKGGGQPFTSKNPATGEILWEGNASSPEDVKEAASVAEEILPIWAETPLEKRIEVLQNFQRILEHTQDRFSETIALETGKPLWEAKSEVAAMIQKVPLSIQAYKERCPMRSVQRGGAQSVTRHKPHGFVAVLGPYNLPGHLSSGHIIPALLAGNTVVFKPSERTPLTGMRMMERWDKTGIPDGVINMVQGDASVGKTLIQNPSVDGVFFTGSYETGQRLKQIFLDRPETILALEMGGNNPLMIGSVEDHAAAISTIILSAFLTTGQRCTCARRLFVSQGKRGDLLLEGLIASTKALRIGACLDDPPPFMGPMIDEKAAQQVLDQYAMLLQKGAKPLLPLQPLEKGLPWLSPGLVDMSAVHTKVDEEIFGPLLQVFRYGDFYEAIQKANDSEYGLSAGIITDDPEEHELFYNMSRAGIINWNTPLTGASSAAPFGGVGRSGNFHPSAYYSADYCSYPVASMELEHPKDQSKEFPGIEIQLPTEHGSKL